MGSRNFKYLDDLIHSGAKEIVLDSDIVLGDGEEHEYSKGIKLDADDLIIDANGHRIDACEKARIFYCTGKRITLKNMTLTRGSSDGYGGAIYICKGDLTVVESIFQNNIVFFDGAAIYNDGGNLSVFKSEFEDNLPENYGAVICNDEGNLIVRESIFDHKFYRFDCTVIYNEFNSSAIIEKSRFINNKSEDGAINNLGHLTIKKSQFKNDGSKYESPRAICNSGVMTIQDTCFDVKMADSSKDVYNDMQLIIDGRLSLSQAESMENAGVVILSEDFTDEINIPGIIVKLKALEKNQRDFTYLDELINGESNKIRLENDILLNIENHEDEKFKNGIKIDKDNFEIDGNGHTIDAQGLTRIFECTGKNIFIKDITLKNGYSEEKGGAIYNGGKLTIMESILTGNMAAYGGAIYNIKGELSITESMLTGNSAQSKGGAIYNIKGELSITESTLSNNTAKYSGGAIHNSYWGESTITESTLTGNAADVFGGAIANRGELTITDSTLAENTAQDGFGGAIYNSGGELTIHDSTLNYNTAQRDGGAIDNSWEGELTITETTLNYNTAQRDGGAICNLKHSELTIHDSTLNNNTTDGYGGAIYLKESKKYESENCTFKDNEPDDVYEEE